MATTKHNNASWIRRKSGSQVNRVHHLIHEAEHEYRHCQTKLKEEESWWGMLNTFSSVFDSAFMCVPLVESRQRDRVRPSNRRTVLERNWYLNYPEASHTCSYPKTRIRSHPQDTGLSVQGGPDTGTLEESDT